jgi:pyruvate dehydrogenase E1 component
MHKDREDLFCYIAVYNENYQQPAMPEGAEPGILKGIYLFKKSDAVKAKNRVQLLGSGPMVNEALKVERWNRLHPAEPAKKPFIQEVLEGTEGPIIATSDYMKVVQDQIAQWVPGRLVALGTDGFGRSDNRTHLRKHFEVDAAAIVVATLSKLARDGKFDAKKAAKAIVEMESDSEKIDPAIA